jgi:esterase/lipase
MKHVPLFLQPLFFHRDGPPFGIKDEALQAQIRAAYRLSAILREWACTWWARRAKPMLRREHRLSSAASKGYPLFPLKTLTDIDRLITRVRGCMDAILAPTVILQAREDDMTNPRNAYLIYNGIGSPVKRLVFLDDCYHVITVDKQRHAVVQHLIDFFGFYTAGEALANKTIVAEHSE